MELEMAFTGDLEHLPIVDVIQLMNSTRKSGVLTVKGRKGVSQLVFKDGYIVSASHLNNSVRIGQVFVSMGMISEEQLEQVLQKQQLDGANRRPLAITLIDTGILTEDDAYKGLQHLIEITVVEILTWKSGKFTLDHLTAEVTGNFKYYPEKMNNEVNVNTQSILMDALRIFDEKMRDGLIEEEPEGPPVVDISPEELISVDDLGLAEIDHLETTLPKAFSGVAPFDPVGFQREKLKLVSPNLPVAVCEKIAAFLANHTLDSDKDRSRDQGLPKLVLASADKLLVHALETVARSEGVSLVAAGGSAELEAIVTIALQNDSRVRVVFDAPAGINGYDVSMAETRNRLCSRHPGLVCLQLVSAEAPAFALEAYRRGVRAVVPRPSREAKPELIVDDFLALVAFLPSYLL
jgi:hypothetical protein